MGRCGGPGARRALIFWVLVEHVSRLGCRSLGLGRVEWVVLGPRQGLPGVPSAAWAGLGLQSWAQHCIGARPVGGLWGAWWSTLGSQMKVSKSIRDVI